jgi:hypothetical protein
MIGNFEREAPQTCRQIVRFRSLEADVYSQLSARSRLSDIAPRL